MFLITPLLMENALINVLPNNNMLPTNELVLKT